MSVGGPCVGPGASRRAGRSNSSSTARPAEKEKLASQPLRVVNKNEQIGLMRRVLQEAGVAGGALGLLQKASGNLSISAVDQPVLASFTAAITSVGGTTPERALTVPLDVPSATTMPSRVNV